MLTNLSEIVPPDLSAIKTRIDKCIQEINVACRDNTSFPIKARLSDPPINYVEQEILKELLSKAGWQVTLNEISGYSKKDWKLDPTSNLIRELYFPPK